METLLRQFLDKFLILPDEEFAMLSERAQIRHFPRRTRIVRIGDTEEYLNLVLKGIVRKFFYKGSHEVVTQLASEGAFISSSISFLSGEPSQYVVETLEPVTLLSISKESIDELYNTMPSMERLSRIITTELYLQKEEIEQDHICLDVKQRFMKFVQQYGELLQRVPQKYIASYLNIKPETFSRLKHHLRSPSVVTT
ncbi:MAG TPA: Crp/Fnr family transcriptional regulator [Chitinophagaceae bacterium]